MLCLVTGVGGFIGSHLAENLLRAGHEVIGVDCFTDYYPKARKLANLSLLSQEDGFKLVELDLATEGLGSLTNRVDVVFHLAAQPGVRASWGDTFSDYLRNNILATQRLLEEMKDEPIKKFIYASSSSIYGDAETLPTSESCTARPNSPYGSTKLLAEQLCQIYHSSFDVPSVILRYFTVYGPRQRPDMAFHKFIDAIRHSRSIEIYGDGSQARDFTCVEDTVSGTLLAMDAKPGSVYNIGTGESVTLRDVIDEIGKILRKDASVRYVGKVAGDVQRTTADISRIQADLGYEPKTTMEQGLLKQVKWQLGNT